MNSKSLGTSFVAFWSNDSVKQESFFYPTCVKFANSQGMVSSLKTLLSYLEQSQGGTPVAMASTMWIFLPLPPTSSSPIFLLPMLLCTTFPSFPSFPSFSALHGKQVSVGSPLWRSLSCPLLCHHFAKDKADIFFFNTLLLHTFFTMKEHSWIAWIACQQTALTF